MSRISAFCCPRAAAPTGVCGALLGAQETVRRSRWRFFSTAPGKCEVDRAVAIDRDHPHARTAKLVANSTATSSRAGRSLLMIGILPDFLLARPQSSDVVVEIIERNGVVARITSRRIGLQAGFAKFAQR